MPRIVQHLTKLIFFLFFLNFLQEKSKMILDNWSNPVHQEENVVVDQYVNLMDQKITLEVEPNLMNVVCNYFLINDS